MSWSKLSFLSFFRKSPKQLAVPKSNPPPDSKPVEQVEKMVFATVVRQSVAKRIPLIKFRRQRQEETALHANVGGAAQQKSSSASGVGVSSKLTYSR